MHNILIYIVYILYIWYFVYTCMSSVGYFVCVYIRLYMCGCVCIYT